MLGVIRFVVNYPAVGLLFGIVQKIMPSIAAKRKQHMKFTEEKIQKRLELNIDRKDFITYVSLRNYGPDYLLIYPLDTPRKRRKRWAKPSRDIR